jgi:hypothetical protein
MAYIGQPPFQEYSSIPTKDRFTGDGSTVAFDLASAVPSNGENGLEVFVNNVRQEPGTGRDFTLGQDGSGDFKRITFASAPTDTHIIYVINDKTNTTTLAPLSTDLNGSELILDADADTSITADTDDRIDIKISGADDFTFSANAFNVLTGSHATFADSANAKFGTGSDMLLYHDGNNSYITNAVGALKIATESSGIAVTIGHTTSQVTIADNLTVGGDLDVTGSFDMSDANITNIGSIALDTITNDGTDITLDSSGDIVLDADGDNITLKAGGTTYGDLTQSGGELIIKSGSTPTTALTFAGANATLAGTLGVGAITGTSTIQGTTITATTAFVPDASDGAALGTTSLEFSDLYLADGAVIGFGDDQDVTLTHVVDTGLLLSSTDQLQFGDSGTYIFQSADGVLDLVSDTEIELNATTLDINANVEISGTATTEGVHTFTAVPVLPANSIDSAHYVDGSIDNAHIADDAIDSEHYAAASIDNEHLADNAVDTAEIADNAVSLAKMAGLARGKIIYGDSSGDPAALTVGGAGTALTSNGTDISWGVAGTAWQAVVTGATTMVAGRGYFVNTTSSAFTMTLPASPSLGDFVRIIDYAGTFDSNTCTIGRNSQKIAGASADMTVTTERAGLTLVFTDSTQGWLLAEI